MAVFVADGEPTFYRAVPGGAESNVAVGMARLGLRAQWLSRLGDDPLGRMVEASIAAAGVDVRVGRDSVRPTGIYIKHVTPVGPIIRYYRSESAARLLSTGDLMGAGPARWMHVSGITAALSPSAARLVDVVVHRRPLGTRISFDLNYRSALWSGPELAAGVLQDLARAADAVFVGDDEAAHLFGTADPSTLAEKLLGSDDAELIIRRGGGPATLVGGHGQLSVPALEVKVVDPTGAGDAFTAGYLAGSLFGWPAPARLRLGHLMGSRVIGVAEDLSPAFSEAELGSLSPDSLEKQWGASSS